MQIVLKGAKLLSTESETCLVVVSSFNRPYMLMTLSLLFQHVTITVTMCKN